MSHMSHHWDQFHQNNRFCQMYVRAGNSCFIGRTICVWSTAFCFQPFITCTCAPRHLSNQFNRTIKGNLMNEENLQFSCIGTHCFYQRPEKWTFSGWLQKLSEDSVTNVNSSQEIWKISRLSGQHMYQVICKLSRLSGNFSAYVENRMTEDSCFWRNLNM